MITISEAENQQKMDNFEPVYLGNYGIPILMKKGLWFLNTLLNTFLMDTFICFTLVTIFPFFFCLVIHFFVSLSTFKPQSADRLYCELL